MEIYKITRVCIQTNFDNKIYVHDDRSSFTWTETPINDTMICSLMLKYDLKLVVKKNQCLKILMESESIISTT
jgi:hypothetical protein